MVVYLFKNASVKTGFVTEFCQSVVYCFCSRLRCAAREAGGSGVDNITACLDCLVDCHISHTGCAVGVENNGHIGHCVLDSADKVLSLFRGHNARHILNADCRAAHFFHFLNGLNILVQGVNRACRKGNSTRCDCTVLDGFVNGNTDISCVVERVENTDDVDAVFNALFNEHSYNIVGIMLVSEKVLTSQKHLKLSVGALSFDFSQSFPRVFVEIAQTGVECCTAPAFHRIVTRLVHRFKDTLEFFKGHSRCDKRLVSISEDGFRKLNFHV